LLKAQLLAANIVGQDGILSHVARQFYDIDRQETIMTKTKQLPTRQRYRKALLLVSFLLFPLTLYYFSPALIIQGASEGIINASFIVFGLMLLSALFVGRLWCGWLCPAGAMQEFCTSVNNKPAARFHWIKWVIWTPWIGIIAMMTIQAGGYHTVDPFYNLEGGITVLQLGDGPPWFMIYYIVTGLFLILAVVAGRRAGCHYICWMAPFMIIGKWIRNLFRWPALRLRAETEKCIDCGRCTRECLMSLDVNTMVRARDMENDECILCGNCVDNCPKQVISYTFSAGK
jgi:ferredoxin-type protein NapH